MPTAKTILVLSAPTGVPLYAAKGLTQTLEPIDQSSQLARDVNGVLVDLGLTQFRKYKSTISCSDIRTPLLDGVWPGMQVTVDCVRELNYLTAGGAPSRPVVAGSSRTEGDFTYYRPQLTMRITSFTTSEDEWGAVISWQLDLEEI